MFPVIGTKLDLIGMKGMTDRNESIQILGVKTGLSRDNVI
jgi:hypothetical protein